MEPAGGPKTFGVMALKIIVVEDKPEVVGHLRRALQDLGHEVCGVAREASDLADLLRSHRPDLVTINLDLGERQDGMGVAIVLEAAGPVPVVFVADPGEQVSEIEESRTIEGTARLYRPFTKDDLAGAIDRALRRVQEAKDADL